MSRSSEFHENSNLNFAWLSLSDEHVNEIFVFVCILSLYDTSDCYSRKPFDTSLFYYAMVLS